MITWKKYCIIASVVSSIIALVYGIMNMEDLAIDMLTIAIFLRVVIIPIE